MTLCTLSSNNKGGHNLLFMTLSNKIKRFSIKVKRKYLRPTIQKCKKNLLNNKSYYSLIYGYIPSHMHQTLYFISRIQMRWMCVTS